MSPRPAGLKDIQAITFDCYGTLIDWEGGAKQSLRALLQKRRPRDTGLFRAEFLDELFRAWERAQWTRIQQGYALYRQIAAESLEQVAAEHELPLTGADARAFADSIATWQPFPDTAAALAKLKQKVRLGLISNIDDDILSASVARLEVEFDLLLTAEQARAYKPSPLPFQQALERLDLPPGASCARCLWVRIRHHHRQRTWIPDHPGAAAPEGVSARPGAGSDRGRPSRVGSNIRLAER